MKKLREGEAGSNSTHSYVLTQGEEQTSSTLLTLGAKETAQKAKMHAWNKISLRPLNSRKRT